MTIPKWLQDLLIAIRDHEEIEYLEVTRGTPVDPRDIEVEVETSDLSIKGDLSLLLKRYGGK